MSNKIHEDWNVYVENTFQNIFSGVPSFVTLLLHSLLYDVAIERAEAKAASKRRRNLLCGLGKN